MTTERQRPQRSEEEAAEAGRQGVDDHTDVPGVIAETAGIYEYEAYREILIMFR